MPAPSAPIDDDDDDEPNALEDAFARYQENGLRLPPVPRELADELDEFVDWHWGNENLNLEDRDGFVQAAHQPGGESEVAFGHVGHGVSSWWLCYRLKLDAVAIFVRLAYGGVYEDAAETVPAINETTEALEDLIPAAAAAKAAGRFRRGHRLIVVVDEKRNGFWEIAGGPDGPHKVDDPLTEAMTFLSEPLAADSPPE